MKNQAVFYGSYDLTLDVKHRLMMPAEVRRCIDPKRDGDDFFLIVGVNRKIWVFTENAYLEQAGSPLNMTPGEDEMAYNQLWYGNTVRRGLDAQFRIIVPDKLLKKTSLGDEVTLVGNRDHLQIWNTAEWLVREDELEAKRGEIAARRAAQNMTPPPRA